jgi:hypothetical protein
MSVRITKRGSWGRVVALSAAVLVMFGFGSLVGCDDLRRTDTGSVLLTPAEFVIPKLAAGEEVEREVLLKNVGAGVLRLINIEGAFSTDFDLYWQLGADADARQRVGIEDGVNRFPEAIDLAPEETMTFILVYVATGQAVPQGRISFDSNDGLNRSVAIPVRGAEIGAELALSPTSVSFGRVSADEMVSEFLVATNVGQANLEINALEMNGSSDFGVLIEGVDPRVDATVLGDPDGDGVPGVAPGQSFEMEITYLTEVIGPDQGTLAINSNSVTPDVFVDVIANGASPCIEVTPVELNFDAGLLGGRNPQLLTISSCGLEPLRIDALRIVDENDVYSVDPDSVPQLPLLLPAVSLDAGADERPNRAVTVFFTPTEVQPFAGTLVVESNDPLYPEIEVPLRGRGSENECPAARVSFEEFVVEPLDVVTLNGDASTDPDANDGRPIRYEWTVVQRPADSMSEPVESFRDPMRPQDGGPFDDAATPSAQLFIDIAGEYLLDLVVTDRLGATAPSEACPQPAARVRIVAEPLSDIHLQLLWDTPRDADQTDDDGSDVDLHLVHPMARDWFDVLLDCSYTNPSPDWGIPHQTTDDPSLDIDDTNGGGPENINLDNPEDTGRLGGLYRVGAHYFRATRSNFGGGSYGSSRVTVRVYLMGTLEYEQEQELQDTNDFWEVGSIVWTDEQKSFIPTNRVFAIDPFEDGE